MFRGRRPGTLLLPDGAVQVRRDEPIVIFVRTLADGTRCALAIGQQSGDFRCVKGFATVDALLNKVAGVIGEKP